MNSLCILVCTFILSDLIRCGSFKSTVNLKQHEIKIVYFSVILMERTESIVVTKYPEAPKMTLTGKRRVRTYIQNISQ